MGRPLSRESLANAMDTKDTVVLVDALLGIGQLRSADNLLSPLNSAWDFLSNVGFWADVRCVALDVPTGLDADTGQPTGECAFEADLTVSFHRGKIGHYLGEGPRWSGRLVLAEIGLPKRAGSALRLCDIPDGLGKGPGHKFSHGHALILAGGAGRGEIGRAHV